MTLIATGFGEGAGSGTSRSRLAPVVAQESQPQPAAPQAVIAEQIPAAAASVEAAPETSRGIEIPAFLRKRREKGK